MPEDVKEICSYVNMTLDLIKSFLKEVLQLFWWLRLSKFQKFVFVGACHIILITTVFSPTKILMRSNKTSHKKFNYFSCGNSQKNVRKSNKYQS